MTTGNLCLLIVLVNTVCFVKSLHFFLSDRWTFYMGFGEHQESLLWMVVEVRSGHEESRKNLGGHCNIHNP